MTYEWSTDCPGGTFDDFTSPTPILTVDSSCGCEFTCTVTLTVDDGRESATCSANVDIVDTTPPIIIPHEERMLLWPPNHKYHTIDVASCLAEVRDACDGTIDPSSVIVTSVTSDEPENAPGMGDGNTVDDIIILCPNTVKLRAEREGGNGHNGRVYTIHYSVTDESGNEATASCQIGVPHDPSRPTIDGPGPGYEETGCTPAPLAGPTPPTDGFHLSRPTELGVGVSFSLEQTGPVRLDVYDIHGRLVERREAELSAGAHTLHWAGVDRVGRTLPSGMYIFRLDAGGTISSQKGVWIR